MRLRVSETANAQPNNLRQSHQAMPPLELVRLSELMARTRGRPELTIGLIDGPVFVSHTDLTGGRLRSISGSEQGSCSRSDSTACLHGTFVAGILSGRRNSSAPAICPDCTLLIRPIFSEASSGHDQVPRAGPLELAQALYECIREGAQVINLSLGLAHPSTQGEQALVEVLDYAARHSVIVVAAAGNQGTVGSSAITRHPWVIPVAACDLRGRLTNETNLGSSIGRQGLSAPGDGVTSLRAEGQSFMLSGTSCAVPFVTGAIALLWSEFPSASGPQIKRAVTQNANLRRASVAPPLLDAATAYQTLLTATP